MRYMYVYLLSQKNGDGIKLKRAPAVPSGRVARVGRVGARSVCFGSSARLRAAARSDVVFRFILDSGHHPSFIMRCPYLSQSNKQIVEYLCLRVFGRPNWRLPWAPGALGLTLL